MTENKKYNVLMYHNIDAGFDLNGTTVCPEIFRQQIEYLHKNSEVCLLGEQISLQENKAKWSLTFDDGFSGVYRYAFPIMSEYNMKGTIYITTNLVNKSSDWNMNIGWQRYKHLSWEQIRELADAGWEVGAHTINHLSLPLLSYHSAKSEILDSIKIIEDKIGYKVKSFSYPFGHWNKRIKNFVEELELDYAVSVRFSKKCDRFSIPRRGVYNFDGMFIFKKIIEEKGWQKYIYGKNKFITTLNNLSGLIINFKHFMR